ncbi:MAG TPA: hypothetical protein VHK91_17740 [Flavisolibacter sp.]|jgi:hypothetical protein|nr:hypothetical protein [Flavisolibacter sp.]
MSMELSFKEKMIQGRIGKRYVIKHYKTYKVKTKVPDMSNIIPSRGQKRQRRLFRLAVQYAQEIYWNPVKREEKERIYRRPWRLFQKLMKEWFKKRKAKREAAQRRLNIWRRNVAAHPTTLFDTVFDGLRVSELMCAHNEKKISAPWPPLRALPSLALAHT